jgi:aspartate carbamoyltransferase catalytic subunit
VTDAAAVIRVEHGPEERGHGAASSDRAAAPSAIQPTAWRHRHLLDVAELTRAELGIVLDRAETMAEVRATAADQPLAGRTVATLFAEASTRTRVSFELAARALGGQAVSLDAATSSLTKGESLIDTVRTLEALGADMLVVRHPRSGAPYLAAEHYSGHVVNAGDGWHAHPTQALLDLFTLRRTLSDRLVGAKVCVVGDVVHSRVARSNIWSLTAWGADVWVTGPNVFLRGFEAWARALPANRRLSVTGDLATGIGGAAAVMALRVQRERLEGAGAPSEAAYAARWALTEDRIARHCPDAVVMHPGPVNVGVELPADVASGPRSLITRQVANGVPVRMAVLTLLAGSQVSAA